MTKALFVAAVGIAATLVAPGGANAIVGGGPASEPYPFMVSLQIPDEPRFHCGGSLVAPDRVLTAAHCVDSFAPDQVVARVGSADRLNGGQTRRATEFVVHPRFRESYLAQYDIAVVKLDEPATLPTVSIASAAALPGTDLRLIGWGRECGVYTCGENAPFPQHLKQLDTKALSDSPCLTDSDGSVDLCVRNRERQSIAQGDSGGPALRRDHEGGWEVVGVTSRFVTCDDSSQNCGDAPVIYTDPVAVRAWIGEQLRA